MGITPDIPKRKNDSLLEMARLARRRAVSWEMLYRIPWWAIFLIVLFIWVYVAIVADPLYNNFFQRMRVGVILTLRISVLSYLGALGFGLIVGLIRSSQPRPGRGVVGKIVSGLRLLLYNLATLYVEILRGMPMLIVLSVFAFVIVPQFKDFVEAQYGIELQFRAASEGTVIFALAFAYGAFMSETFRAGIQSIEKGQIEAARSLGMNYVQVMRYVVLPQAVRRVLPPLGNDFIAIIKDSSLASVFGIQEITQIAKVTSGSSFRFTEVYVVAVVLYLSITLTGSLVVRWVERAARIGGESQDRG